MTPSTMRALWVALRPHQHSASTWSSCTRSASSMSRREPGEELGAEVGGDAEGVHVDVELVDDPGELLDLHRGVELRLVTDEVVDPGPGREPLDDLVPEVEVVADLDGRRRQAQPRGQHRLAHPVELGEDQALTAARPRCCGPSGGQGSTCRSPSFPRRRPDPPRAGHPRRSGPRGTCTTGTATSSSLSDPCRPRSASSSGRARRESTTAKRPRIATTTSPIRRQVVGGDRAEPPGGHGLARG